MDINIILLCINVISSIIIIFCVITIMKSVQKKGTENKLVNALQKENNENRKQINEQLNSSVTMLSSVLTQNQELASKQQKEQLENMYVTLGDSYNLINNNIGTSLSQLETRFQTLEQNNEQKLNNIRETISQSLKNIQDDNSKKLDEIRGTVEEKLQKTLEDKMNGSFKLVSEQLEQVYKSIGEMQNIATGVGDLKKILSNVKTRGILGEIQLGNILSEILTPDQYDTEVATVPGSKEHVEFAIKLPANDQKEFIYLPIDSKFPGDTFSALQDAYNNNNPEEIKAAYKALDIAIKKAAKDIHDKYICLPYTTSFAIMFLPFEGLYAEVVNHGLVEVLQREYSVNIAGPSTMAAMLNSLQMGFKTLQIQKRSNEVWTILSSVKTEFENFNKVFESAKNRIKQLDDEMDKLVGVRSRAIMRKLRDVETIDPAKASSILEIAENMIDGD